MGNEEELLQYYLDKRLKVTRILGRLIDKLTSLYLISFTFGDECAIDIDAYCKIDKTLQIKLVRLDSFMLFNHNTMLSTYFDANNISKETAIKIISTCRKSINDSRPVNPKFNIFGQLEFFELSAKTK